jgi:Cysteine-rich CPCC
MAKPLAQCDCCDYFTISEGDDYEICPVCFWEQDAFGVLEPDEPSGANNDLSLSEGRKNFRLYGACAAKFKTNVIVVSERDKYRYAERTI